MAQQETSAARLERLGRAIADAKVRLAAREDMEGVGIGGMLEALSEEIDEVVEHHGHDDDDAHARLDGIERRLAEAHGDGDTAAGKD